MTRITLEVEQIKDLQLIIELAKRLKIRYLMQDDSDLISKEEAEKRAETLKKFKGKLAGKGGYQPDKYEWYEQAKCY